MGTFINRFNTALAGLLLLAGLATLAPASAAEPVFVGDASGAAIDGYDVVSYFSGLPQRGLPNFAVNYRGADWYFASAANAAKFRLSPDAYIPKYGGFCAYGVANGYLVKSDPLAWSIHQGRLYLNFNAILRVKWLNGRTEYLSLSEKYWPKLIG